MGGVAAALREGDGTLVGAADPRRSGAVAARLSRPSRVPRVVSPPYARVSTRVGCHAVHPPGRDRRRRHRPRGRRRGPAGPRRGHCRRRGQASRRPTTTSAPAAGTPPARRCPTRVLGELRGHDAILLGAVGDPGVPSGVLERGLLLRLRFELDHYVNLRPARLYPGVDVAAGATPGRHRLRRRPRGHRGPVRRQRRRAARRAPRTRSPPRSASTRRSASSASCATRSAGPQARPRRHLTLVHKHNVLIHAGHLWRRTVERRRRRVPRGHDRLPARRRGDDLPGHGPGAVRRDRHRQPVRRHRHRPRRAITGGIGLAASGNINPDRHGARACSSRSTARPPTSPARAWPTRPPRSCRSRCCSSTSACDEAARGRAGRRRRPRRHAGAEYPRSHGRDRRRHRRPRRGLTPRAAARVAAAA